MPSRDVVVVGASAGGQRAVEAHAAVLRDLLRDTKPDTAAGI